MSPFSGTARGPPLSPWQVSVPFAQAQSFIFACSSRMLKNKEVKLLKLLLNSIPAIRFQLISALVL